SWNPIPGDPGATATPAQRATPLANRRLVDDWLAAIAENREPACSGQNAAKAVEMAHAVWRAGLTGGRVALPLKERGHALASRRMSSRVSRSEEHTSELQSLAY